MEKSFEYGSLKRVSFRFDWGDITTALNEFLVKLGDVNARERITQWELGEEDDGQYFITSVLEKEDMKPGKAKA